MKIFNSIILRLGLITSILIMQGCTSYDPISVKECKKVVKHAQKVLGKMSPPYKDLLKSCKEATDTERGCIMAAKKMGQITQCS